MNEILGFGRIFDRTDNAKEGVNVIGELSPLRKSYSSDVTDYYKDGNDSFGLSVFKGLIDGKRPPVLPTTIRNEILNVIAWVDEAARNGVTTADPDVFQRNFEHNFASIATTFTNGDIVVDGNYYCPKWIKWVVPGATGKSIKIWFSDDSLRLEYPDTEIRVLCPIEHLDDFFKSKEIVKGLLDSRSDFEQKSLINALADGVPYTTVSSMNVEWHNKNAYDEVLMTDWATIAYGPLGTNHDSIRRAIIDFILANSVHNEYEWSDVFPDLFLPTEFTLLPLWYNVAIPEDTPTNGVFRGMAQASVALREFKKCAPSYEASHVDTNWCMLGTTFNSVMVAACGSKNNKDGRFLLTNEYPEYINVVIGSNDFYRMDPETQQWASLIHRMVTIAATYRYGADLPSDMASYTSSGYIYISAKYRGSNFLVVTKSSYEDPLDE